MSNLQISDILAMPDEELDNLSDAQMKELLEHLIPAARKVNPEFASTKADDLVARLSKRMGC